MAKGTRKNTFLVIIAISLAALSFILGMSYTKLGTFDENDKLDLFLQALDVVKTDFVKKDLDDDKLIYGSIRGLLASLEDPYTRFMEPQAFREMKIRMSGTYSGVGIYIGIKGSQLIVISPIPKTPAEKAGLRSQDKIMTIDGKPTKDM
ncbi:MAG: PDZ domain-containing protein, partial [Candidatus Saganbacteria bacterium]|nr:PDZ domain-containing protein [Candidatus Saganbacteria bacterium]